MKGYINTSGLYQMEEFGPVHINVRTGGRTFRARWKMGRIHLYAPRGIPADAVLSYLRSRSDLLDSVRPDSPFAIGATIELPDFKVAIKSQSHSPEHVIISMTDRLGSIEVGTAVDISTPPTIKLISKGICRMAQSLAPGILLPLAHQVADRVGKKPLIWTISHGHRILGHCNSKGEIALSYALLFYPKHLREYVICHELAHLTELNHSPRFHQLCDTYCSGSSRALQAELRAYRAPIPL